MIQAFSWRFCSLNIFKKLKLLENCIFQINIVDYVCKLRVILLSNIILKLEISLNRHNSFSSKSFWTNCLGNSFQTFKTRGVVSNNISISILNIRNVKFTFLIFPRFLFVFHHSELKNYTLYSAYIIVQNVERW